MKKIRTNNNNYNNSYKNNNILCPINSSQCRYIHTLLTLCVGKLAAAGALATAGQKFIIKRFMHLA